MNNLQPFLILAFSFTCCTVIFIFIVATIYKNGTFWIDQEESCKDFEKGVTNFTMDVPLFRFWHNHVDFNEWNGFIQLKCPSITHDVEIFLGGELIARTDTKVFDLLSRFEIFDCHGQKIASSQSTTILAFKSYFEFDITDHQGEPLGTVQRNDIFVPILNFFAVNGTRVAEARREILSWTWRIQVFEPNSKLADLKILMGVIAKRGIFRNEDEGDLCNSMVSIMFFCAIFASLFTFGFVVVNLFKVLVRNEDFFVFDIRV